MQGAHLDPYVASGSAILDRVFVAVDFSINSHRAVGVALELKRVHGSRVCLFHSEERSESDEWLGGIGSPSVHGDWVGDAREALRRFLENIAPGTSTGIEIQSRIGPPIERILDEVRMWKPTLIVMAAHLHKHWFRGARALRVLDELELPMLIVPGPAGCT